MADRGPVPMVSYKQGERAVCSVYACRLLRQRACHLGRYGGVCQSPGLGAGLWENRFHHEIYLSDVRQCQPERLKTVIRQPVRKVILKQLEQDAGQAHDHGNEVQQTLAGKG